MMARVRTRSPAPTEWCSRSGRALRRDRERITSPLWNILRGLSVGCTVDASIPWRGKDAQIQDIDAMMRRLASERASTATKQQRGDDNSFNAGVATTCIQAIASIACVPEHECPRSAKLFVDWNWIHRLPLRHRARHERGECDDRRSCEGRHRISPAPEHE